MAPRRGTREVGVRRGCWQGARARARVRDAPWVLLVARARYESPGLSACGERNKCEMTTVAKTAMGGGSREGRARVSKSIAAGSLLRRPQRAHPLEPFDGAESPGARSSQKKRPIKFDRFPSFGFRIGQTGPKRSPNGTASPTPSMRDCRHCSVKPCADQPEPPMRPASAAGAGASGTGSLSCSSVRCRTFRAAR